MKLYEISNGSIGESYVKVFVIEENEDRAKESAIKKYKQDRDEPYYHTNLEIKCLCEDTSTPWASCVRDY